jgi:chorismate--pyruvate lyase
MKAKAETIEPTWSSAKILLNQDIPLGILSWLKFSGSSTKRMSSNSNIPLIIKVLNEEWSEPRSSEAKHLNIQEKARVWVREIEMYKSEIPQLYARCIFPETSLNEDTKPILNLGNNPMGALIFQDSSLKRSEFEFACLNYKHTDFQNAVKSLKEQPEELWARRSAFTWHGQPFLLNEIILPGIF